MFSGNLYRAGHWGRGNGWGSAATAEVLIRLPQDHPQRQEVAVILGRYVEAIVADHEFDSVRRRVALLRIDVGVDQAPGDRITT